MSNKEKPEWLEELEKAPLTSRLRRKESLKRFNTWRIGGVAECLIDVVNVADLSFLLSFISNYRIPWFILGKGSNLLIPDTSWPGIILHLSGEFKSWEPLEKNNSTHYTPLTLPTNHRISLGSISESCVEVQNK